jgi:deoxyhypusine synthase
MVRGVSSEEQNEQNASAKTLKLSAKLDGVSIAGYDFNEGVDYEKILDSFASTGYQATQFSKAIGIINKMRKEKATIFLGYTSNMVSSGLRDVFRYLVEHKHIDVVTTTAGGIEEDIIKCLGDFSLGDFRASGKELYEKGINRIGNIYVPNERYVQFEDFIQPILKELYEKQMKTGIVTTPSDLIWKLGEKINNKKSIYYWAWKNQIRVFCPAITDGAIGGNVYFFKFKHPEFVIDITEDNARLNNSTIGLKKSGVIILGSGIVKHSLLQANLFRNGADYGVYINNSQEFDGSDAGAMPEEAISWGKLQTDGDSVKVFGDATILFPLIVGKCFVD